MGVLVHDLLGHPVEAAGQLTGHIPGFHQLLHKVFQGFGAEGLEQKLNFEVIGDILFEGDGVAIRVFVLLAKLGPVEAPPGECFDAGQALIGSMHGGALFDPHGQLVIFGKPHDLGHNRMGHLVSHLLEQGCLALHQEFQVQVDVMNDIAALILHGASLAPQAEPVVHQTVGKDHDHLNAMQHRDAQRMFDLLKGFLVDKREIRQNFLVGPMPLVPPIIAGVNVKIGPSGGRQQEQSQGHCCPAPYRRVMVHQVFSCYGLGETVADAPCASAGGVCPFTSAVALANKVSIWVFSCGCASTSGLASNLRKMETGSDSRSSL